MRALTLDDFTPHVGSRFRLQADEGDLEMELSAAEAGGVEDAPRGARPPFSLTFRGPPGPILPQRIYRLEHDGMGELEIFLVPIGADPEGVTYEAVFA